MLIAVMTFRLHAPWVHSLKEKRMIVRSLTAQLQNKFMFPRQRLTNRTPIRSLSLARLRSSRTVPWRTA